MTHPNQTRLAEAYAAFESGDLSIILGLLNDDVSWQVTGQSPVAGTYVGKDQVVEFFGKMMAVYGGTLRLDVRSVLADGDHGMVLTAERASYHGDDLAYTSVHVYRFQDGRCASFVALQDDAYDRFWTTHPTADVT